MNFRQPDLHLYCSMCMQIYSSEARAYSLAARAANKCHGGLVSMHQEAAEGQK